MKAIKFIYAILMLLFNPLAGGLLVTPTALFLINKFVYGAYPDLESFSKYSSPVWNPLTITVSLLLYYLVWKWLFKLSEQHGWKIL